MPLPFNKSLDHKLLDLVRENPILYNTKHSKYLDFDSREVVWQKIGDILSRPASEFAGIQCQIQLGDFQEDKHKPGFIENLNEYLPEIYSSSWGIEKKLLKAYRKHQEVAQLEAKNLYIKTARDLPTYGVTFYLVKEKQKGKKKLVPRLLGINAKAILRLDENTKEILQQWPLTHVKTYHVGKSETFTLNFGDYSDKEYSCKTQDAYRIRDILEGYIDMIRKRMFAKPYGDAAESMAICHDNIQTGQSHMIQHVEHHPSKLVQETFVGPNKIVAYDQGSSAQQGTQIVSMRQIIQTNQLNNPQNAMMGQVAVQGDMSSDCVRKLKRMNSNSVKIVTLLTDPTDTHIKDTQKMVGTMKDDLVLVEMGVKATADQQTIEESKKMLLDEMQDLVNYVNKLSDSTRPGNVDTSEAKDAAEKIAHLTSEMCFSQDPRAKRRSELLNRSRKSIIAGEKLDETIRRASFIAAASGALGHIDQAKLILTQDVQHQLSDAEIRQLRVDLQDRLGKLNAALALYLTAHSDPNNVDYSAAINSMNAITSLSPNIATNAQKLSSTQDSTYRKEMLGDMNTLFDGAKNLCSLTGTEDHDKVQEASNNYADIANKLLFTLSQGRNVEKENEIIDLAKDAGAKTSMLLMSANSLTGAGTPAQAAADVDAAGVTCAGAARDLLACAQLTAPAINEPHCQSALTAAAEGLSSSVHRLSSTWKPLVEEPSKKQLGEQLHQREMDVHKALERLKDAYANLSADTCDDPLPAGERQRLKFVRSLSVAKNNLQDLDYTWSKPAVSEEKTRDPGWTVVQQLKEKEARRRLAEQMAQLNAAIAALTTATTDRDNPDYASAELALNTISELMPQIVKDMEVVSSRQDEATRAAMQQHVTSLCEATKQMFANVDYLDTLGESAAKFSTASSKLIFLISPEADKGKEKKVAELSTAAYDNASELLSHVYRLKGLLSGEVVDELDTKGTRTDQAARALLTVSQVTAPTINEARCSSALASAVEQLRGSASEVTAACLPHLKPGSPEQKEMFDSHQHLENSLKKLQKICPFEQSDGVDVTQSPQQEKKRLHFIMGMSEAKKRLAESERLLKTPLDRTIMSEEDREARQRHLSSSLAQLNAAVAALAAATADRKDPDHEAAERAVDTITKLMPHVVGEARSLAAGKGGDEQRAMLEHVQKLCDATTAICDHAGQPQGLNDAAAKFAATSGKLVFLLSPAASHAEGNKIIELSASARDHATELVTAVKAASRAAPEATRAELDGKRASTADAAKALLTTAQLTAHTITSPHCSEVLVSAAEHLRTSAKDLTSDCRSHLKPGQQEQQQMQDSQQNLENSLDKLLQACQEAQSRAPGMLSGEQRDKQRLHFINSISGAKSRLDDAQNILKQPASNTNMSESDAQVLQRHLSSRLAQLNAAVAALAAATADREHPNYAAAQRAVNNITTLMPQLVQDVKSLSFTKEGLAQKNMLQQVEQLCGASRAICDNAGNPQGLSEAAAKFADASGTLMYTISPVADHEKEKQIIDLSSLSCVRASELLSHVQSLTQQLPPDVASELDSRGASTADAAQALLSVAQVTASSMSSPHCQKSLESAVETLRGSADELSKSCSPHVKPRAQQQQLDESHKQLMNSLDTLLLASKGTKSGAPGVLTKEQQEKQRLLFINSLPTVRRRLDDAQNLLKQPAPSTNLQETDAQDLQRHLSDKLSQLNAAIAALTAATADREHPNYAAAQRAVNNITTLMPQLVQDAKTLSSTKDGAAQKSMLQQVEQLCDASRAICDNVGQAQGLSEAAAKFAATSGKLMYTVSPVADREKEKQIIDLSSLSCVRASELLSHVQSLTQQLPPDVASELDSRGASTADAAQALLSVAQVTASSMSSPHCQKSLESVVETLRGSAGELSKACSSHLKPGAQQQQLDESHKQLMNSLDTLLLASKGTKSGAPSLLTKEQQEKQRLLFINSLPTVRRRLDDAQNLLKQPAPNTNLQETDTQDLQRHLSDKLSQLNAAIAALTAATADREHPNYAAAQRAVNNITTLMPQLVQDAKTLSSTKDGAAQKSMLQQVEQVCDASRAICDNVGQAQGLSEAAVKFAATSGKLMYTVSPAADHEKEKQIIELSSLSCVRASELLSHVQSLTQQLPPDVASELDSRGASTADAAQALLSVAQVTASSMSSPHCQKTLESVVEMLRGSAGELSKACSSHLKPGAQQQQLDESHKQLMNSLDTLLLASKGAKSGAPGVLTKEQQEKQRLLFINSLPTVRRRLDDAQNLLKQPAPSTNLQETDAQVLQRHLSDKLSQLNAAIAALTAATADREHPNYAAAQRAVNNITTLMPQLVQDAKTLSSTKDGAAQKSMLQQVEQLCDASRAICDNAGQAQGLSEAAAKFAATSGKLMFTVSPAADHEKEKQIIDLSSLSCVRASELLSHVQSLTQQLPPDVASELDSRGASTADAAQALLSVAQVTASSMSSPHCQKSLESVVEMLRGSAGELSKACSSHLKPGAQQQQLDESHKQLTNSLNTLLLAIRDTGGDGVRALSSEQEQKQRIEFIRSVSTASTHLDDAEKHLNEPLVCPLMKQTECAALQHQLGRRLGQINMSVATLTAATTDYKHPDYPAAERSIITITELMPKVIQESKILSCTKDEDSKKIIHQNLNELYGASRNICNNADDPKKLNEESIKLADASGKLVVLVGPSHQEQDLAASHSQGVKAKGPAVPVRAGSKPSVPVRSTRTVAHAVPSRHSAQTQDFLNILRSEECNDNAARVVAAEAKCLLKAKSDEEKSCYNQFSSAVDIAESQIKQSEDSLKLLYNAKEIRTPGVDPVEMANKEQHMEDTLAKAGVQVAALVSANYADKLNYKAAVEPTVALTESLRSIVADGSVISSSLYDSARKSFLNDLLGLCDATRHICEAARNDNAQLNEKAISFGNQSAKLLRVVCADVNPGLEKEVISRAKAIGDSASRLALEASNVASNTAVTGDNTGDAGDSARQQRVQNICTAGAQSVDAAGKLVYTAKLVAPTIHHSTCQDALILSADTLSSNLATFSNTWKPLASDPHTSKLTEEAKNLQTVLEKLETDVKSGILGKRRAVQYTLMLDTPLRQMTVQIIDNARSIAEYGEVQPDVRQEYKNYCSRLEEALRTVDLANARCQRAPHDRNRRNEMEIATQDLQIMVLQTRPARAGQEQNNIVDFRDFLQGLVTESDRLVKTAEKNQAATGKRVADDIRLVCSKISEDAEKLTNPMHHVGDDSLDDMMEIYEFGQDCDVLVKELDSIIRGVLDQKARNALQAKLLPIVENCNFVRFATNNALSTAKSAAFDAALQELDDFDNIVIKALYDQYKEKKKENAPPIMSATLDNRAQMALLSAASSVVAGEPQFVCRALTNYTMNVFAGTSDEQASGGLSAIFELTQEVKQLTEVSSVQSANWEKCKEQRQAHEIVQKGINKTKHVYQPKLKIEVLKEEDTDKLLVCQRHRVEGTPNQLQEKFQQLSTKLCSMSGSIFLSLKKPESLARSLHATADAAAQLANTARALKDDKELKCQKIEDACTAMCLATRSLLITSELVCQDPNHHDTRRRLLDACHYLHETINQLNRATHPTPSVSRECSALLRGLQLQHSALQFSPAPAAATFSHCIDTLHSQRDVLHKLNSDQAMPLQEFLKSMLYVTSAVGNSAECAAHATYLLSVSEKDKEVALEGVVDVGKMHKSTIITYDTCVSVVRPRLEQVAEIKEILEKQVDELLKDLDDATEKTKNPEAKLLLQKCRKDVAFSARSFYNVVNGKKPPHVVTELCRGLADDVRRVSGALDHPALVPVPAPADVTPARRALCDQLLQHATTLVSNTQDLIKEVKLSPEQSQMKWSSYNKRRDVLATFDALLRCIKITGQEASILEADVDDSEQNKSYVQIQTDTAFKWLHKPMAKSDVKLNGQEAVRNLLDVGRRMSEDLSGADKEDMRHLVEETEQLFSHCCKSYDQEQYSILMERIRELKKAIERMAVTRLVEDFMDAEEPLADLDILADAERDEKARKFLLERKIAELLAQLGRVNKTARFIAHTGAGGDKLSNELRTCSEQTELLAPMLVKAAEQRIQKPDDQAVIDHYRSLLAKYTDSLTKVRDLCDQSVDPMDFVQTAGETMQRMREDSTKGNDPMKGAYTSTAITKLANRVIQCGLASRGAREDPELQRALGAAQAQLRAAAPASDTRASRMPDWKDTTAKILRATEEVESVLGGETIFKQQPDTNQPIYNEALNLHVAIRDWSSRDNEIVAVAKRMAVLMAKLSNFMNTDKQREVLTTSKSIVAESHEVARLAKKLAHECSDHRIKTNLLQVCERIPTISGQLKMLTTVKGSSLGHHGTQEDKEAMDMLVGNAQSLMISIQDVVKAAASASVKIMSQRGPKIKWVRKTYY